MGRRCFCGCSNAVVVLLNAGMMMVALVILGLWLTTASRVSSACDKFLQMPLLILGLALLVVSFVGLVGACCRAPCLLWLYLATTFFFIIGVCCFTVFAFVVSNKSAAAAVSSRGVGELRLGDYAGWLRRTISDGGNWEKIQSCLKQGRVCGGPLQGLPVNPSAFYKTALSPIQAGCCNPPAECRRKGQHGTADILSAGDCARWRDDPQNLCFACDSCKAGVLANIQLEWKSLAIFNVALLVSLVLVYFFGCCALRSGRQDRYNRYRPGPRPRPA